MRSIYYLERYMVLAIGFVVCGADPADGSACCSGPCLSDRPHLL